MRIFGAFISSLCLAATLLTGSAAAQADAGINFFAEPAPGSNSSLGYFVIDAEPGDSIKQAIALRNDSKKRMTLRLYGADATTSIYGGADYTSVDTETTGVGSWIALQDDEVTLKPKEGAVIRFRVRVPTDAPTGENLGGIAIYPVIEPSTDEENEAATNQASAQVVVEYRRIVAVQVNTPGKAEPNLVISGIEPTARPDGAYLDMNIANEGTALTKGTGIVRVPGFDFEREFDLDTFVPGSKIFYPLRFDDSIPVGDHDATIRIEYDEGDKVVEWNSTFAVGEELQAQLAERGAPGALPTTTRGNLVPLALALALGFMMLTFFRRTRRQVVPAGQAPSPIVAGSAAPRANETEPPTAPARYVAPSRPSTDRPKAAPKKPARRRTPASAKTTGTKKSTAARKPAAKRTTAKKTTAKKTAAKRTPRKKGATKPTAPKKTAAKKTSATTTSGKKKTSKKSAPKKATAKKTTSRKSAPKKATAKKTPRKKTTAKKTSATKTPRKKTVKKSR